MKEDGLQVEDHNCTEDELPHEYGSNGDILHDGREESGDCNGNEGKCKGDDSWDRGVCTNYDGCEVSQFIQGMKWIV